MDAITHPRRYNRRAASLVSVCIIVSMSILQGPTTFSWADDAISPPPDLTPVPGEQPRPISGFVPLPTNELQRLNAAARSAANNSPVRRNAVKNVHHANVDAKLLASLAASSIVRFQVSEGTFATVQTDRLEQGLPDTLKWSGHVPGDPNSSVHLIVDKTNNSLFGDIRVRGRLYEIRPIGNGAHTIYTLDPSRLPPDHSRSRPSQPTGRIEDSPMPAAPDYLRPVVDKDGTTPVELAQRPRVPEGIHTDQVNGILVTLPVIDVMVLYTQAAATQSLMGMIGTQICQAIGQVARALVNSGVQATIRLVHHGELNYDETKYTGSRLDNLNNILSDIKAPSTVQGLQGLRTQYGADVVSFWVSDSVGEGKECGLSSTLSPPGNADAAYSVVLRTCATASLSFAHELGHLLGANHDRFEDSAGGSPNYNWGYVKHDKGWRTIMAYNRSDCKLNNEAPPYHYCDRLEYWSNPTVIHDGDATGESTTASRFDCSPSQGDSPSKCRGPAYNKLTLDTAAPYVANFRTQNNTLVNLCENGGSDTASPMPPSSLRVN